MATAAEVRTFYDWLLARVDWHLQNNIAGETATPGDPDWVEGNIDETNPDYSPLVKALTAAQAEAAAMFPRQLNGVDVPQMFNDAYELLFTHVAAGYSLYNGQAVLDDQNPFANQYRQMVERIERAYQAKLDALLEADTLSYKAGLKTAGRVESVKRFYPTSNGLEVY